jgi:hypothetical protein
VPNEHEMSVLCPFCGATNVKNGEWVRLGGEDFDCEVCGQCVHMSSADWYDLVCAFQAREVKRDCPPE